MPELAVAEDRIVGRLAGDDLDDLTPGQVLTLIATDYLGAQDPTGFVRGGTPIPTFYDPLEASWSAGAWWTVKVHNDYSGVYYGWKDPATDPAYSRAHVSADDDPSAAMQLTMVTAAGSSDASFVAGAVGEIESRLTMAADLGSGNTPSASLRIGATAGPSGGAALTLTGIPGQTLDLLKLALVGGGDVFKVNPAGALTALNGVTVPVTGVGVNVAAVHAALVTLGLITL